MSVDGSALAAAARALVGTRFRLYGRDPTTGLDCVGLFTAAMAAAGRPVAIPACYALRNCDLSQPLSFAAKAGLGETAGPICTGDVLLARMGPAQAHLLVALSANGFVHAHAGLRRIVETPGPFAHPLIRHWRLVLHN